MKKVMIFLVVLSGVALSLLAADATARAADRGGDPRAPVVTPGRSAPTRGAADESVGSDASGWRALLIAGDTVSPVFNNALNALKQRLISLGVPPDNIKSVQSGPSLGEATAKVGDLTNGFQSLKRASSGPCFLYATSHGTERGLLFAVEDGHTVLLPHILDAWLNTACKNRPTVVVLSGCYSGVYVDSLRKADDRVILSAARRDRVSFGCSARDELSVFDGCFLQNFLPERTWRDLADGVRRCVEQAERTYGEVPSLPQTFVGRGAAEALVGLASARGHTGS